MMYIPVERDKLNRFERKNNKTIRPNKVVYLFRRRSFKSYLYYTTVRIFYGNTHLSHILYCTQWTHTFLLHT